MATSGSRPRPAIATAQIVAVVIVVVVTIFAAGFGGKPLRVPAPATTAPGDAPTTTGNTPAAAAQPVSFSWVGDMMIGSTTPQPKLPPANGTTVFAKVKDLLPADLQMGNLEGPLTDTGPTNKCAGRTDCFIFSQPPGYAQVYKDAGFQLLNLANNHSNDRGLQGAESTVTVLKGVGIASTGLVKQPAATLTAKGTKIAALGFYYSQGTNTMTGADGHLDTAKITDQVKKAGEKADLVVVMFHGGVEGERGARISPTSDPVDLIAFAHTAVDAGADLVVGSGPHVLRGMEFYNGRLIAYSLGNFAVYGYFDLTGAQARSAVLHVTLNPDGTFAAGKIDPVRLDKGKGIPEPGGQAIPTMTQLSAADFPQSGAKIKADGTFTP